MLLLHQRPPPDNLRSCEGLPSSINAQIDHPHCVLNIQSETKALCMCQYYRTSSGVYRLHGPHSSLCSLPYAKTSTDQCTAKISCFNFSDSLMLQQPSTTQYYVACKGRWQYTNVPRHQSRPRTRLRRSKVTTRVGLPTSVGERKEGKVARGRAQTPRVQHMDRQQSRAKST